MNNVIEFEIAIQVNGDMYLHGFDSTYRASQYLGSSRVDSVTKSLHEFGLKTAVAPFEWPAKGDGVTWLSVAK